MISTESSQEACNKYANDYLSKVPESEKWKRILSALLSRFAIASIAAKNQGRIMDFKPS